MTHRDSAIAPAETVGRGEDVMAVPLNELVRQATEMQAGGRYINGRIFHGLVAEIERLEKLALPAADREAMREALKEAKEFLATDATLAWQKVRSPSVLAKLAIALATLGAPE